MPEILKNQSAAEIHRRMMEALPPDIDNTEGGFPWDMTYPTALEKAELVESQAAGVLQIAFPMWAHGVWLDNHAQSVGIERRAANHATGFLEIEGNPGAVIDKGAKFAVPASGENKALEYIAAQSVEIDAEGLATLPIISAEAGRIGNVAAHSIQLLVTPIRGIIRVDNPLPITGGAEPEDDESLWERIDEINKARGMSYVGNDADYIRWAKEMPGVGHAAVVRIWDGPGTVKLVLTDAEGMPANEMIMQAVYAHIMGEENEPMTRLAPIGVALTVAAPEAKAVDYAFTVHIAQGYTAYDVKTAFMEALKQYYKEADAEKLLRYSRIGSLLIELPEVLDYADLRINGGMENIVIDADAFPVTGEIEIVEADA